MKGINKVAGYLKKASDGLQYLKQVEKNSYSIQRDWKIFERNLEGLIKDIPKTEVEIKESLDVSNKVESLKIFPSKTNKEIGVQYEVKCQNNISKEEENKVLNVLRRDMDFEKVNVSGKIMLINFEFETQPHILDTLNAF